MSKHVRKFYGDLHEEVADLQDKLAAAEARVDTVEKQMLNEHLKRNAAEAALTDMTTEEGMQRLYAKDLAAVVQDLADDIGDSILCQWENLTDKRKATLARARELLGDKLDES